MWNIRFYSLYLNFQDGEVDALVAGIYCLRKVVVVCVGRNDDTSREFPEAWGRQALAPLTLSTVFTFHHGSVTPGRKSFTRI